MTLTKENDFFISSQIPMSNKEKLKTLTIVTYRNSWKNNGCNKDYYKNNISKNINSFLTNYDDQENDFVNNIFRFKKYNAITNCKSAGIIPYTYYNGKLLFLLQRIKNPSKKKDSGWNDFGGKRICHKETTIETAAREFNEETSCLFYLKEQKDEDSKKMYLAFQNNNELNYSEKTINDLKKLIPISQKYFANKISQYVLPIHISSKETYISYFLKVKYLPEHEIPNAEDIHIQYEDRYIRECKWFSFNEIIKFKEKDFHKRLQITKIQQRMKNYLFKKLFN